MEHALGRLRSSRIEGSRCPENVIALDVAIRKARLPRLLTGETLSFPTMNISRASTRQPTHHLLFAKRRRQEKATREIAVCYAERTRRHRQGFILILTANVAARATTLIASRKCLDHAWPLGYDRRALPDGPLSQFQFYRNTTVLCPFCRMRCSTNHLTARASTTHSTSRPMAVKVSGPIA
jgi:hypothetical protein